MDRPIDKVAPEPQFPAPISPETVRRAREHMEHIHAQIRARGVDMSRLPDPVEVLSKARETGSWE